MLFFIAKRIASGVVLLAAISLVAFSLLFAGGDDVARRILGPTAPQATVETKASQLGLDRPLWDQYVDWLSHAVTGDLGISWFTGEHVSTSIGSRIAVTLSIIVGATVITAVAAVLLGVTAALRRGWIDRAVQAISFLGFAVPGFLVALALVVVFAINLGWFKPTGYIPLADSPVKWASTVTLPVIALSIAGIAGVAQQVRSSVIDALERDYVRTLRSRGLSMNRVVFKHVLRNAGGPALSVLALQFIGLLGGAVIIEQIFAIPGLGQVAVSSTTKGDTPLVMGLVLATAIIVVVVNLLIDLLQAWLNPKVRLS
ncbi:ABC transporter permease [Pseudarthrobacter sp. NPDC058329]|uniref:ABC transporter permease n=1 Tax=Pseudarthrobacter sp. NPDC058329 TaxID=3346448 RepID=UPI0036DF7854